jgi:hypothetical protein
MTPHLYSKKDLENFQFSPDAVLAILQKYPQDAGFASHTWLLDMPAKRMIFADVYRELLSDFKGEKKRVLDIAGGYSGITRELVHKHSYTLVDTMVHDDHIALSKIEKEIGSFWQNKNWFDFTPDGMYDYIIANDMFPNVDQRLEAFIKKYRPFAKKLIITLTCYDNGRSYQTKRVDAEEEIVVSAWNTGMTGFVLGQNLPGAKGESLFENGRIVYKIIFE